MMAVVPRDGHVFFYGSRLRQPLESRGLHWLALTGAISLIWLMAWLMLRHLLRPVRRLAEGVAEVEAGNLSVRLSERGHDELAELGRSFNAMTSSLRERLRARDQLLLDVSHELRSPLTRMRVALEMAPSGGATESLREDVDALEKMISEILETERLRSGSGGLRRGPVDLGRLLGEVAAGFSGQAPGMDWAEPAEPITVSGDAERIRLVFRNVLENAFNHGAGTKPVRVSLHSEPGFAVVQVRDSGPGIPENEQRLVFEPVYRTDRSRSLSPGYGLGLSLCKRIVEMHGGPIAWASRAGAGTTVSIRLPAEAASGKS
jgi:signal transduction histidine kinase